MELRWASQDGHAGRKGKVQTGGSSSLPPGTQRKILSGPGWGSAGQEAGELRVGRAGKQIRQVWRGFVKIWLYSACRVSHWRILG